MSAPFGHSARILELAAELRELADKIERETAASIVETRTFGMLCGSVDWQREAAPEVQHEPPIGHPEPVNSSAMIPPRQLYKADAGAE